VILANEMPETQDAASIRHCGDIQFLAGFKAIRMFKRRNRSSDRNAAANGEKTGVVSVR
jgi:hypothetical protein